MPLVDFLAATGQEGTVGTTSTAVLAAVCTAFGALLGTLVTGLLSSRRERTARRHESQRAALYDLQQAALDLSLALQAYGAFEAAGADPSPKVTRRLDAATGRLELAKHRIICETVRDRVDRWRSLVQAFYLEDDTVDVAATDAAWSQLQEGVGEELRRLV